MSIQRHLILLALALGAFGMLTMLFMNTRGAEQHAYAASKDMLREMRELDSRMDSQTLQVRYTLAGNFDGLVATIAQLTARYHELERRAVEPELRAPVVEAAAQFALKRDLVEDIKSQAAILRNSSRYLPVALGECELADFAAKLGKLQLASMLSPSAEARAAVDSLIAASTVGKPSASLARAAQHARVLSERSAVLDQLVTGFLASPSRRALDTASLAYESSRQRHDDRAAVYRLGLYSFSAALLFYLAVVLVHLARLNRSVKRFVPYEFLQLLGHTSVAEIAVGDCMQQEMTVLFADIRSFTTISEKLEPRGVFQFINTYMARMEPCIQGRGGVVSQYYGDGIMAIFPGAADDAVDAGVAMLGALAKFNAERVARGEPPIQIGIGLNTGPLILGTIGGPERLECNVISDVVNFSSRIEGMNKMYGTSLLISDRTHGRLKAPDRHKFRVADHVRVKGMERPCTVYEVMDGQDARALPEYELGLEAYHKRDFAAAQQSFAACHAKLPTELLFRVWHERCEHFVKAPPAADWDGVVRLEGK